MIDEPALLTRNAGIRMVASLRKTDLVCLLERSPQQVRPQALRRLDKQGLREAVACALSNPVALEAAFKFFERRDRHFDRSYWL